ncbi:rhodanese-like domain-containing protein [Prosthecobacter sp.]|uniref:rhodanese-like domain-containing protein n=1 Tax=Prosthecobacter sp. TaxID=1965333 RepID=UPI003783E3D7
MLWPLLSLVIVIAAWYLFEGFWDRQLFSAAQGRVCVNLSADEANAWLREHPETQVLDVRSVGEFSGGALPRALNVSIGDAAFDSKVGALDKTKPVLVYCAGGFRSRKAVAKLKELGFKNIQHIHRGYMSWKPDAQHDQDMSASRRNQ